MRIEITEGDITEARVDAIVNAANNQLQLGGGVAGAIRKAGGPTIQEECDRHGPIEVGEAAITYAGNLPATYVIHAASMSLGSKTTEKALRSSVRYSLELADSHDCKSVAFPAIGAGIAGFPLQRCAEVMSEEIEAFKAEHKSNIEEIRFVLFGEQAFGIFRSVFEGR